MLGGSNGRARSNRRAKGPARAILADQTSARVAWQVARPRATATRQDTAPRPELGRDGAAAKVATKRSGHRQRIIALRWNRWATRCAERVGRLCRVVQSNQTSMDLCFKTDSLREDDNPKPRTKPPNVRPSPRRRTSNTEEDTSTEKTRRKTYPRS